MQPVPAYPDNPLPPDALRVVNRLDWRDVMQYQRIDLGHAQCTVETRARSARHMARNGFSWPTFVRSPRDARAEARRWIAWKKAAGGDAASAPYELVVNDVARYLAAVTADETFELAVVPITDHGSMHPDPYSPGELAALGAYEATHPFTTLRRRALHVLDSFWGARRGEHSRTDEADLDLEGLTLAMRLPGKRGRKRKVPLPSLLASPKRALVAYLAEKHRRFPGVEALWVDNAGVRMSPADLSRETFHMSQDLGFSVSFNRWRRSWQTTVRRCGVPKEIAKYLLGHQWGRDATDHYWDPTVEEVRAVLLRHKVPGFIRSREAHPAEAALPVPFAREIETAPVM